MSDDKISFSKEVAETLSIESAIILQKTKENKYKNISSIDKLITTLKNELSFIDDSVIKNSINELNHEDMVVAIGIIIKPISLKK